MGAAGWRSGGVEPTPPISSRRTLVLQRRGPAIAPERIAYYRLGMKRANPIPLAAHPRRRVRSLEGDRLAFDRQHFFHLVGDDRHVFTQHPHLHVAQIELMEGPAPRLQHAGKRLLADAGNALSADDDARI